jgi:NAD(P)-dependent dehydrogenase (short-subunit alcohol dehydrogenase family)
MGQLSGKVALVTGAGQGIGRATAQLFAREGANVVVADINPETSSETVELIREAGGDAIFVETDVSVSADVQRMVYTTVDTFGALDCAVNGAVLTIQRTPIAEISEDDWERTLAVNYTAVFLCMKYEIKAMIGRDGAIVNIGSGNEHTAKPGMGTYLPAKHAVYGLTKVAALDYADHGIRVNAVGPGSTRTPLRIAAERDPNHVDMTQRYPLKRLAEPEEIAAGILWLCTPAASYVLGHTLLIDGASVLM